MAAVTAHGQTATGSGSRDLGPAHSPVNPEVRFFRALGESSFVLCLLHSDDFVTTFFVGFSNDSQTWVMYTNGYEEMVGATEMLGSRVWTWEDGWEW